jgi:hypothetical protein
MEQTFIEDHSAIVVLSARFPIVRHVVLECIQRMETLFVSLGGLYHRNVPPCAKHHDVNSNMMELMCLMKEGIRVLAAP